MTGKPVIASNWSGHKDFLPVDGAVLIGGSLTDVDESAIDTFIIKGSKWFTANYGEFSEVLKLVNKDYELFLERSEKLGKDNSENFSITKMSEVLDSYLSPLFNAPKETKLILPKLNKVK